jgi:hypothetical protein
MAVINEVVYKNFDNEIKLTVKLDGAVVDWTSATGFILTVNGVDITSGITGGADSVITFDIGDAAVTAGVYNARLVVQDATHPLGQVVFDTNSSDQVKIRFV